MGVYSEGGALHHLQQRLQHPQAAWPLRRPSDPGQLSAALTLRAQVTLCHATPPIALGCWHPCIVNRALGGPARMHTMSALRMLTHR